MEAVDIEWINGVEHRETKGSRGFFFVISPFPSCSPVVQCLCERLNTGWPVKDYVYFNGIDETLIPVELASSQQLA